MQAIVYTGLGVITHGQLDTPEPAPGEVLIRVKASGVCHTDIDVLHGRYGPSAFPLVPGHEYAGVVEMCGDGVDELAVGDQVVIDPNIHCGTCRSCRRGQTNLCENLGAYGVTCNGGFGEFCVVQADHAIPVVDMPAERAALAEPVGCVLNGLEAIGTDGAENALVFGAGPIGMLLGLALRVRGVTDVTMVDLQESRLELATSFGLEALHASSEDLQTYRQAVDIAVDATGVSTVAEGLCNYAANGGRVLYFGVCPPDAQILISPFEVFRRQLRIGGAHSLNHNISKALDVIREIGPDIDRLISHRVALQDIPGFLDKTFGSESTLKVQAVDA